MKPVAISIILLLAFILAAIVISRSPEASARKVALSSSCMEAGNLTGEAMYNEYTRTWWFELDTLKEGCNPACVVYQNRSAEVNWRCTGLIEPLAPSTE